MNQLNLSLPDWINSFLNEYPKIIPEDEKQMRFVLALTERNIREETGGPFGSAVFERDSGKLVSVGVNVVVRQNCSAAHAEMCAMCLGNVCWSGVSEVLSSAEPEDVEKITGFDEGPTPLDYNAQLERRGIKIVPELLRSEGLAVLQLYVDLGGQVYNARHSQESSLT